MIKDNQKLLNRIHVVADACLLAISYVLSYFLRFYTPLRFLFYDSTASFYPLVKYAEILIFLIPGFLIIYYACNLYSPNRVQSRRGGLWNIVKANFFGVFYFTFILYATDESDYSRYMIFIFFVTNVIIDTIFRSILSFSLQTARKKGYNLKHIILVGYSRAAENYIDRILVNPEWGYYIHGILDDTISPGTSYKNIKVIILIKADITGLLTYKLKFKFIKSIINAQKINKCVNSNRHIYYINNVQHQNRDVNCILDLSQFKYTIYPCTHTAF